MSTANLKDRLVNSEVGEVFLELFEDEMKSFKPVYFENLVTDYTLLTPIPQGPTRGVDFSMRLPKGDLEETKKAVQSFLLTRKLQFTLQKEIDTLLPLKANPSKNVDTMERGKTITLTDKIFECHMTSVYGVGECVLMTEGSLLLVLRREENNSIGRVQDLLELQNIEVAPSQGDENILLTKAGTMKFKSAEEAIIVKEWIETEKQNVRFQKLKQLYLLLGIDSGDAQSISRRKSKPLIGDMAKPSPLIEEEAYFDTSMDSTQKEEGEE